MRRIAVASLGMPYFASTLRAASWGLLLQVEIILCTLLLSIAPYVFFENTIKKSVHILR